MSKLCVVLPAILALGIQGCGGIIHSSLDARNDDDEKWMELSVTPPPYPKMEALLEFPVEESDGSRYYVDPASISIGSDGVARYTLVVVGAGGAVNVSYEGIFCSDAVYKRYDYGRNNAWAPVRDPEWQPVNLQNKKRYQSALFITYFCPGKSFPIPTAEAAVQLFKRGPAIAVDTD